MFSLYIKNPLYQIVSEATACQLILLDPSTIQCQWINLVPEHNNSFFFHFVNIFRKFGLFQYTILIEFFSDYDSITLRFSL